MSLYDFHSHALPGIDDGSRDANESKAMLEASFGQGVGALALTPHFYARHDRPEHFLKKRAEALERLSAVYDPEKHPTVFVGAEVAYYEGPGNSRAAPELTLGESKFLLIEMPFSRWNETVFRDIDALRARGIVPIVAHIERYMQYQKRGTLEKLIAGGCLLQSNAEFFLEKHTAKKALKMLKKGQIALLGSDMHNLTSRPQQLLAAATAIENAGLGEALSEILDRSAYVFSQMKPALS